MLSFKRVVCTVAVCAMVGAAFGGARKIKDFEVFAPESAAADGMAILNYVQGQDATIVQVILSGFEASTEYVVIVQTAGRMLIDRSVDEILLFGGVDNATGTDGSVVTDEQGHLTLHQTLNGNFAQEDLAVVTLVAWNDPVADPGGGTRIAASAIGGSIALP